MNWLYREETTAVCAIAFLFFGILAASSFITAIISIDLRHRAREKTVENVERDIVKIKAGSNHSQ